MVTGPQSRWDQAYRDRLDAGEQALTGDPALILRAHDHLLPATGRAIDVASGLGKNAAWLAGRGLDVVAADISAVAVDAINHSATTHGLAVRGEELDIETHGLGDATFDVIAISYFLDRALLACLASHLAPGGLALFAQPTVTNLERNAGPSERFSLGAGEVVELADALAADGLDIVTADEKWRANTAHEAWLVVRRPDARD